MKVCLHRLLAPIPIFGDKGVLVSADVGVYFSQEEIISAFRKTECL